jgi:diaminohydroxyphosphoribosylaminopyrimidine deaminase/5-amino-6-(5-phosphoribosylamino)uracil reductase
LRVILDSQLRLPLESRLVRSATDQSGRKSDVLVFCCNAEERKKKELEARGIRIEQLPANSSNNRVNIHDVLQELGKIEITSVMIEGGATVNGAALSCRVVDKVFFYYAPKILACGGAITFASGAEFRSMDDAPQVKHLHLHRFGSDFAVEGYLRDPYQD